MDAARAIAPAPDALTGRYGPRMDAPPFLPFLVFAALVVFSVFGCAGLIA